MKNSPYSNGVSEARVKQVTATYTELRPAAKNDWEAMSATAETHSIEPATVRYYLLLAGVMKPMRSKGRRVVSDQPNSAKPGDKLAGDLAGVESILQTYRRLSSGAQEMVRRGLR